MRFVLALVGLVVAAQNSPGIQWRSQQLDGGLSETAALADLNNDGRLDIISSESWYEAPAWTKRPLRTIPFTNNYVDNFSDLPLDVDGDGFTDIVQIAYFARRLAWLRNPGKGGGDWGANEIETIGPTEFAFLVDLNNDGRANDLLPQFTGAAKAGLCWYELRGGKWIKREVAPQSFGHGIGAGDLNGDKRTDILTPRGWLEAPADPRAPGPWTFHETDWLKPTIAIGLPPAGTPAPPGPPRPPEYGFMHVIDVNKDGRNDVVTTMGHSWGVLWFEQTASGAWVQHLIDNSWSRSHASALADVNGDGQLDLVTGTRFMGRNADETEPLAMYWYEFRAPATSARGRGVSTAGSVQWIRHTISAGGQFGGGLQTVVGDIGRDGDLDIVSGGKSGLFLAENVGRTAAAGTPVPIATTGQ